jgi:hypothetical protein
MELIAVSRSQATGRSADAEIRGSEEGPGLGINCGYKGSRNEQEVF